MVMVILKVVVMVMLKVVVMVRGGGDYKLQAASLTNDLTTASKTTPFQNLLITTSLSFSFWL